MGRDDRDNEVVCRNDALARTQAEAVLIGGLPDDARNAMLAKLPAKCSREITADDAPSLARAKVRRPRAAGLGL